MTDRDSAGDETLKSAGDSGEVLPAEEVFLECEGVPLAGSASASGADSASGPVDVRPSGPGFWESVAWMIGLFAVQTVAAIGTVAVAAAVHTVLLHEQFNPQDSGAIVQRLTPFLRADMVYILGVTQAATIGYGLLVVHLRHRPDGIRRLGWALPSAGHWLLVGLLMPPLWLICSALQSEMFKFFPDAHRNMEELFEGLQAAPLPLLIAVIGLGPALGEELVFRGLIGRGLIARYGFLGGMLLTSVLFGFMHINPAQAIGVIPLGLAMHFVYLTTRSFWAPVAVHLCNNSLSMILLKVADFSELDTETGADAPWQALAIAAAMVLVIAFVLWKTRVRYVLPDGSLWSPGFATSGAPPAELGARRFSRGQQFPERETADTRG